MKLELQGKRFGRLTVVAKMPPDPRYRNAMWNCRCDCGNYTIAAATNIGKSTLSCGCLAKETAAKQIRKNSATIKHGMAGTPEYQAWTKLKLRCYDADNPKYYAYGARGISVCDRWRNSFEDFFADMGPRPSKIHSINRVDNDGNYEPSNCRWDLPGVQNRNARFNRIVTIDGISLCVAEWCDTLGIPRMRPYDMTRATGRKHDGPARFASIDDALEHVYRKKHGP